jgi:hypothetical protein
MAVYYCKKSESFKVEYFRLPCMLRVWPIKCAQKQQQQKVANNNKTRTTIMCNDQLIEYDTFYLPYNEQ